MTRGICMHCEKEMDKNQLVTLRQFKDKPTLCLKCAKITKEMETGIDIEKMNSFFKKVSKCSKKIKGMSKINKKLC